MKQIMRINHVGLRVRNLDSAREFYEKLGFEFIAGPVGPEPVAVMEHPTGININFILNASADASDDNLLMDVPEKIQVLRISLWRLPTEGKSRCIWKRWASQLPRLWNSPMGRCFSLFAILIETSLNCINRQPRHHRFAKDDCAQGVRPECSGR